MKYKPEWSFAIIWVVYVVVENVSIIKLQVFIVSKNVVSSNIFIL